MTVLKRGAALRPGTYSWLVVLVVVVASGAWFGWMTVETSRTEGISAKVSAALNGAIESLAPTWPRIEVHDSATGELYYAPETADPERAIQVFGTALIALNQDVSVPPVKITRVVLQSVYGSPDTTVLGYAEVEFPLVAGLYRTIHVRTSTRVPHYQSPG